MKSILITLLLYLGLLGCQNKHNPTSSSIEDNHLTKTKFDTKEQETEQDTIEFIADVTHLTKSKSNTNLPRATQDTIEFITFWEMFRNAVLGHDIKALSSMLHDSIFGAELLTRNFTDFGVQTSQTIVLEKFYDLFTPDYLLLLQEYDIHKDLFSDIVGLGYKKYQCEKKIGKRTYEARIFFQGYGYQPIEGDSFTAIVCYTMSCDMKEDPLADKDYGWIYNITFSLEFHQILNEFKLYEIGGCFNMTVLGG